MSAAALEEWLRSREPKIPLPLLAILLEGGGEEEAAALPRLLRERAFGALEEALARPGRDREAAFRLLAGDAFLTYACEALAGTEDVGGGLARLLRETGERFAGRKRGERR